MGIINVPTFIEDVNEAFTNKQRQQEAQGIRDVLCKDCLIIYKKALGEKD
jgi:hypothetical protein